MSIIENKQRIGNFTSSEIYKLISEGKKTGSLGAPALTYIKEKRWERKMKRSINTEVETRPILWGRMLEPRVHELIGMEYEHINDLTLIHPKYDFVVGSPDFKINLKKVVSDSKCYQPKAFCEFVDNLELAFNTGDISHFRDNHKQEYWQLINNATILGSDYIESIVYMPYESELEEIRAEAENFDGLDQYKYRFIAESSKHQLAYLPNDSEYKNLNVFRFPLIKEDAEYLEQRIILAYEELQKP